MRKLASATRRWRFWASLTLALVKDKLYGVTLGGGSYSYGTVFELTGKGTSWTETILYNFTGGADGNQPISGLAVDSKGNLYGSTYRGGSFTSCDYGCGVIFKVKP